MDPHDAVGIPDRYSFDVRFLTEIERFDRHLGEAPARTVEQRIHYLSICSPNHLHDAHVRLALRAGADAICEKPPVINPWNLDALQELESESGAGVRTVLQLRFHPALLALKEQTDATPRSHRFDVSLAYVTARGGGIPSAGKALKSVQEACRLLPQSAAWFRRHCFLGLSCPRGSVRCAVDNVSRVEGMRHRTLYKS